MGNSYAGGEVHLTYLSAQKAAQNFNNNNQRFVMSSSKEEVHYV